MARPRHVLLVVLVGLVSLAAACGDDGGDPAPSDDSDADTTATTTPSVDPTDPSDPDDAPAPGDGRPGTLDGERRDELIGRWIIRTYAIPGSFTNPIDTDQEVFVDFGADGTLTYHTGCNQGSGTWSGEGEYYLPENALDDNPEGQPLRLADLSQTEIGCEGFLGDQDVEIPAALRATTRFVVLDDGTPALFGDETRQVEFEPSG